MIIDRTLEDVEYAKANPTSTEDLKGSYNNSDLNRVEEKVEELYNILKGYSYDGKIEVIKTDWLKTDFFTPNDDTRYLGNIRKLINSYFIKNDTPSLPNTMEMLTYEDANAIEKILVDIENIIINMEQTFVYSGVSNSGQNRVWQQRFRRKYLTVRGYTMFVDADGNEFVTADDEELYVKE